jgi:very-short-patch-repair endonuclease
VSEGRTQYAQHSTNPFPSTGGVSEGRGGQNDYRRTKITPTEGRGGQHPHRNTRNYKALPYNPKLKKWARENRQAGNLSEVKFWNQVKKKQFKGFDFDRQKIIGNYIVDFYCSTRNVVVEIDGSSHNHKQAYDARRDAYLESLGLTVIHIRVEDIFERLNDVMEKLMAHPALQ